MSCHTNRQHVVFNSIIWGQRVPCNVIVNSFYACANEIAPIIVQQAAIDPSKWYTFSSTRRMRNEPVIVPWQLNHERPSRPDPAPLSPASPSRFLFSRCRETEKSCSTRSNRNDDDDNGESLSQIYLSFSFRDFRKEGTSR